MYAELESHASCAAATVIQYDEKASDHRAIGPLLVELVIHDRDSDLRVEVHLDFGDIDRLVELLTYQRDRILHCVDGTRTHSPDWTLGWLPEVSG